MKGGQYDRWLGPEQWCVNWRANGVATKQVVIERYPYLNGNYTWKVRDEDYYFKSGITYTNASCWGLGARAMASGVIFEDTSPAIFAEDGYNESVMGLLNTRTVRLLAHVINPTVHMQSGDTQSIPLPIQNNKSINENVLCCVEAKRNILKKTVNTYHFDVSSSNKETLLSTINKTICDKLLDGCLLSIAEANIEKLAFESYGLSSYGVDTIINETNPIPGLLPVIKGIDDLSSINFKYPELLKNIALPTNYIELGENQINDIRNKIIESYKLGSGSVDVESDSDIENNEKDDDDNQLEAKLIFPSESLIAELSIVAGVNPVSTYNIIEKLLNENKIQCSTESQSIASDLMSTTILRSLGHLWPKQIEANEQPPTWADEDGVIPLTEDCGEKTLLVRIRERIIDEFPGGNVNSIEQEFSEILGTSLDKWLIGPFFKRHISQFKKRPVAWHIQSSSTITTGGRAKSSRSSVNSPAFAALIYYQKIGYTTILDIRKLYVDKLRISYETELRTLEGNNQPTLEQSSRKIKLENWIDELKVLDRKLERLANEAFGPDKMRAVLRQYAINDAMLSLVACWLKRLAQTVQTGPLKSWKETAEHTELHKDFPQWLSDATARLDHFCSDVGPKAPEEKKLSVDPSSAELAPIISSHAAIMVKNSIVKACDSWWRKFDEAVLLPVRQKIGETDDKANLLEEERDLPGCPTSRKMEIERLLKQLKADIKGLKNELSEKTEKAKIIRREMESWQCKEAALWEGWLATQPLFDKFAQLDVTKAAPSTIAEFIAQESAYYPDINDGVRVNIAPLQKAGLLAADVIASKDLDKAISDRADWRADERRWCREGKLPQPGWWKAEVTK
ncbi:MAG: hypothetical protein M0T74_14750 [Desulfitobacterium hafniense]|nr:hypothetical protein [Desulfitobacterium hafniense]